MEKDDLEFTKQLEAFTSQFLKHPHMLTVAKVEAMSQLDTKQLALALAAIHPGGDRPQEHDALRAAANAIHYGKMTDSLIAHMDELNKSNAKVEAAGRWLARVAIGVAVVDVLVGVAGVLWR